ncbi:MAG: DNA topoisomerase 1 [Syntrophomonadaceae bacterium]|nr:DNA topoisomerase 1 [Bacillota bacterium]
MNMRLMIVESPNKIAKITQILESEYGKGKWMVMPTYGHIKDIVPYDIGINVAMGFQPRYALNIASKTAIKNIQRAAVDASAVYIATDPDREGEFIAGSVREILGDDKKTYRVSFNSITKKAVLESVQEPRFINDRLISAAQARRVIDRLIGYILTPIAREYILRSDARFSGASFSVGRTISPALSMVIERFLERKRFIPTNYYRFIVEYDSYYCAVGAMGYVTNLRGSKKYANLNDSHRTAMMLATHTVRNFKFDKRHVTPPPAHFTASLISNAFSKFGIPASKTMAIAQKLYSSGGITYPRTDSPSISDEGINIGRDFIQREFGDNYLRPEPVIPTVKASLAQESHECIRPVSLVETPDFVEIGGDDSAAYEAIYGIIKDRFLGSLMSDAVIEDSNVEIGAEMKEYPDIHETFHVKKSNLKFDGFMKVAGKVPEEFSNTEEFNVQLHVGGRVLVKNARPHRYKNDPPALKNEGTLVDSLAAEGIGRPSTYSSIIDKLKQKDFVREVPFTTQKSETYKGLMPTEIGVAINNYLEEKHPWVLNYKLTKDMEEGLDAIAEGRYNYKEVVNETWEKLNETVPELRNLNFSM